MMTLEKELIAHYIAIPDGKLEVLGTVIGYNPKDFTLTLKSPGGKRFNIGASASGEIKWGRTRLAENERLVIQKDSGEFPFWERVANGDTIAIRTLLPPLVLPRFNPSKLRTPPHKHLVPVGTPYRGRFGMASSMPGTWDARDLVAITPWRKPRKRNRRKYPCPEGTRPTPEISTRSAPKEESDERQWWT